MGNFTKSFQVENLYNRSSFPSGSRLYMSINITEDGTEEMANLIDTSTIIGELYQVFLKSPPKFKPGLPYKFHVSQL